VQTYAGHAHAVLAVAVAADNARLASGGGDRAVLVWDVAGAAVLRRLEGHGARVNDVAWGGDGVVVSGESSPHSVPTPRLNNGEMCGGEDERG
jgi:mitogen-activated protein kinase organizer 1